MDNSIPVEFDESGECPDEVSFKSDGGDPWTPSDTIGITVCLDGTSTSRTFAQSISRRPMG